MSQRMQAPSGNYDLQDWLSADLDVLLQQEFGAAWPVAAQFTSPSMISRVPGPTTSGPVISPFTKMLTPPDTIPNVRSQLELAQLAAGTPLHAVQGHGSGMQSLAMPLLPHLPMAQAQHAGSIPAQQPVQPKVKRYTSKAQKEAQQRFREKKKQELLDLQDELQSKILLVEQLEAENARLHSRDRVLTACVRGSEVVLSMLQEVEQLRQIDSSGQLGSYHSMADEEAALQDCLDWLDSLSDDGLLLQRMEPSQEDVPLAAYMAESPAGTSSWGDSAASTSGSSTAQVGPASTSAMGQDQSPVQQLPIQQHTKNQAEQQRQHLHHQPPMTQTRDAVPTATVLFKDVDDVLPAYRDFINKLSALLRAAEAPAAGAYAMLELETYMMSHSRRFNTWVLSSKAALKLFYVWRQSNLETMQVSEAPPGHWQRVVNALQLRQDQQQDLITCQAMFGMASSRVASFRRQLIAQLQEALPLHPDAQPSGQHSSGTTAYAGDWQGTSEHIQALLQESQSFLTRSSMLDRLFSLTTWHVVTPLQLATALVLGYPWIPCWHSMIQLIELQQEGGR